MLKNFLKQKVNKITKRQKEIKHEYEYRGLDIIGTSAFKNMEIMDELEKEYNEISRKKSRYLFILRKIRNWNI